MIVLYEKNDVTLAGITKYENMLFLRTSICSQAHLTGSGDLIEFQSAPCNRLPVCLENTAWTWNKTKHLCELEQIHGTWNKTRRKCKQSKMINPMRARKTDRCRILRSKFYLLIFNMHTCMFQTWRAHENITNHFVATYSWLSKNAKRNLVTNAKRA